MKRTGWRIGRLWLAAALLAAVLAGAATGPTAATPRRALPAHALVALGTYGTWAGYPPKCNIVCKGNFPYSPWAYQDGFILAATPDGLLEVSRLQPSSASLVVETIDPASLEVKATHTIRVSGGWKIVSDYLASDGSLYVLTTHANRDDSDARDVIAVRKYDSALHEAGVAKLTSGAVNGGVNFAPGSGSPSMTMLGSKLVVSMSRLLYASVGSGHHEASLAFVVDTSTMTAAATSATYVSHSFNQFVVTNGTLAVFLDHGDAYPRALAVDEITGWLTGMPGTCTTCMVRRFDILKFRGSVDDNFTGATANGFAIGPSGVLTVGVADPDQHGLDGIHGNRPALMPNAYLISTNLTSGSSRFVWLTRNRPTNPRDVVGQPRIAPIGSDRYAILFGERLGRQHLMEYRLVNSAGAVIASQTWRGRQFSAFGPPAVVGNRLFWAGSRNQTAKGAAYLYALDIANPAMPTLVRPA